MKTGYIYYPDAKAAVRAIENSCVYHHTSLARGYHSTKAVTISEYNGKFGKGYTIEGTSYQSNRYHEISYFILKED